jgi:acetylornithine deacetylase/succinyl-diaminopimelate desuccinylase-like protein
MIDVFALTRALVDIESVSGNEMQVGEFLAKELTKLARAHGGRVEKMPVEGERFSGNSFRNSKMSSIRDWFARPSRIPTHRPAGA